MSVQLKHLMPINHHIVLASRPSGVLQPAHFRMETCAFPKPGLGETLLEMEWLAMGPYLRGLARPAAQRDP